MAVKKIPEGYHSITPFFMSGKADELVEFMKEGLGAKEISSLKQENGKLWHAQLQIGDSMVMVGDSMGMKDVPMSLYIYIEDADAAYAKAMKAGGTSIMAPMDQFYGDRNGGVKDPFGNTWWLATHIEDVSREEMQKRAQVLEKRQKSA